jgi:hypothetical protein
MHVFQCKCIYTCSNVLRKRQLVYKFETWNIHKYRSKDSHTPAPQTNTTDTVDTIQPGVDTSLDAESGLVNISHKRLIADFCAAVADDYLAFELYVELLHAALATPLIDAVDRDDLLISCARSVQQPDDAQRVIALIEQCRARLDSTIDPLLLSILEVYVRERSGTAAEDTNEQGLNDISSSLLTNGMLNDVAQLSGDRSIVTFQFLAYILRKIDHSTNSRSTRLTHQLLLQFLSKQLLCEVSPQNNHMASSSLRSCIVWCQEQLKHSLYLPQNVNNFYAESSHHRLRDNIQLFCALWHASHSVLLQNDSLPPWCNQCKAELGISPTELLLTVSWMIAVNPISTNTTFSPTFYAEEQSGFAKVHQRAFANATVMAEWPEKKLWAYFLQVSTWLHEPVHENDQDEKFEAEYIPKTRAYISSTLCVELNVPKVDIDGTNY